MLIRKRIVSLRVLTIATLCGIPACDAVLNIQDFPAGPVNDATFNDATDVDGGTPADGPASLDASTVETAPASDVNASADVADASVTDVAQGSLGDSSGDGNEAASGACNDGDNRCLGSAVQTCVGGEWDAAFACDSGACNGAGVCGLCLNAATQCSGSSVQTCTNGQWGSASACGDSEACIGNACAIQLTASGKVVWATVGLPVSGPVASVTDTNASDSAASLTAIIDWGDSSSTSVGIISGASGSYSVAGTHTYSTLPSGGQATVAVTVTAPSGAKVSTSYSATVRPAATANINEISSNGSPLFITAGSDGAMWFTESDGSAYPPTGNIARLQIAGPQTGSVEEFPVSGGPYGIASGTGAGAPIWFTVANSPTNGIGELATNASPGSSLPVTPVSGANPWEIISDGNGYMWFTDSDSEFIWRTSTTNSSVTNFTLPNGHSESYGIAAGGGYIWIVEGAGPLARVSPGTGDIVEYGAVEMGGTSITGIAVGPNGDVWSLQPGQIGSLDPATSVVTNFTIPIPTGGAIGVPGSGIVFGPDGNIWYTDANSAVVRMTVTGAITQFATPTMLSGPGPITVGPDGNIWFTENSGKKIGRISP